MSEFRYEDIPDLSNQVIIVTGGNAGLGLETIRGLSRHNASRIYLAARSQEKAEEAIKDIQQANPEASSISFLKLDLASFESVKSAAADFLNRESRLDILVNNAGIMMTPEGLTEDGYEIQFGTNVMGPALFTQLLLPLLRKTAAVNGQARVVLLSSASHAVSPSDIYNFGELRTTMSNRGPTGRYTISKLAVIHYAKVLAEREKEVKVIAVHPGMVATNLHHASTGLFLKPFLYAAIWLFATPAEKGALSQIWATVSPDAKSGHYYGPVAKDESGSKLSQSTELREGIFGWIQHELSGHVERMT